MTRLNPIGNLINWIFGPHRQPTPPDPAPSPTPPIAPPVLPPTPPPPVAGSTASDLVRAINAARAAAGLPALAANPALSAISAAWAARLAATGVLDHGDFPGRIATVAPGRAAGEDIGLGYPTAEAEVRGWASDAAHRAILLGDWDTVGTGVGVCRDGRLVFVADFVRMNQ